MEWWIWLLIALGILLVVGLVIFFIVQLQQKPKQATLIRRIPEGTTLINTGSPVFKPDTLVSTERYSVLQPQKIQ